MDTSATTEGGQPEENADKQVTYDTDIRDKFADPDSGNLIRDSGSGLLKGRIWICIRINNVTKIR